MSALVELAARDARYGATLVVIARYLSPATRARLRDGGVGYLDLTGNARIVLSNPGLFIETHGASENPDPTGRPTRT